MADAAGWRRDPDDPTRERYWDGSAWTDSVRPVAPVPGHGPQLHRALAAATDDIDAVESRLSALFERTHGQGNGNGNGHTNGHINGDGNGHGPASSSPSSAPSPSAAPRVPDDTRHPVDENQPPRNDDPHDPHADHHPHADHRPHADIVFTDLDEALAAELAEEPEHPTPLTRDEHESPARRSAIRRLFRYRR